MDLKLPAVVKPAVDGLIVRDPATRRPLPPAGREVPDTVYWRRRARDGDIVAAGTAPAPKSKEKGK